MRLKNQGPNQTEIVFNNGDAVFFSYETPVAAWVNGKPYKTGESFSKTTKKHINTYFGGMTVTERKQEFFDKLIETDITDLHNRL